MTPEELEIAKADLDRRSRELAVRINNSPDQDLGSMLDEIRDIVEEFGRLYDGE